ncbi:carbamoyl phosphate synthase [Pseudoclavibacter endophyticus]|uniref:ATP-grasp domain-containing protein n=1 Tax=Pseudoclavibacter endophyticus TaxID=1778590 RepID=A0A6H9WCB1_9MICO|nr:ATP-grasp domain-containing protein [Pseudoclavibacter endophyticus]KAB1648310.1 ATP-grasp domain-containing protein [Pseudoclavibacter endophyticus]GGA71552.1 carbamoyl phosphate synthase [Pseudoclavibacter endophyticus]
MSRIRVLVTGAGGPAGVAVIRSLLRRGEFDVVAADMDGWASGLYFVGPDNRRIIPPGLAEGFFDAVAAIVDADGVDVVVSTVDAELSSLAARRDELGAVLAAPSADALATCLDKWVLVRACAAHARVPESTLLDADGIARERAFPVIVKPRRGSGSRGVRLVESRAALEREAPDDDQLVQEYLPGDEYSVDVFMDAAGNAIAAVPRLRARVDSGVAVAGRTVRDDELERTAAACARAAGIVGVANVQLRYDVAGVPALLEINPRFSGAMPLTVASGVDMPSLAVDLALGRSLPVSVPFREIANVRYLEDVFVEVEEIMGHGVGGA